MTNACFMHCFVVAFFILSKAEQRNKDADIHYFTWSATVALKCYNFWSDWWLNKDLQIWFWVVIIWGWWCCTVTYGTHILRGFVLMHYRTFQLLHVTPLPFGLLGLLAHPKLSSNGSRVYRETGMFLDFHSVSEHTPKYFPSIQYNHITHSF